MSAHHHEKIEHFFIHLVTVLFLLSSISTAFLGYGVYQKQPRNATFLSTPVFAIGSGWFSYWTQTSWNGGASPGAVTTPDSLHTWPNKWNKYDSATNVVIDASGVQYNGSGNGTLVTSIFDFGTKRLLSTTFTNIEYKMGNSVDQLQSASWIIPNCNTVAANYRYVQFKLKLGATDPYVDGFTMVSAYTEFKITVKDSATQSILNNATISHSVDKGTTPSDPYIWTEPEYTYENGKYIADTEYSTEDIHTITISAPGYISQTIHPTPNAPYGCDFEESITVNLVPQSSPSSSQLSSSQTQSNSSSSQVNVNTNSSSTTSPQDTTPVSLADFQKTILPSIFTAKGSKTTDLSKVTDHTKIANFTVDVTGKNKVVFNDTLDLSIQSAVDALTQLDKYVKLGNLGVVQVDSKSVPAFNKKATIYMYGLDFVSTPDILVDGVNDKSDLITNINYDANSGILSFDIAHFTTYKSVPKIEIFLPENIKLTDNFIRGRVSDPKAKITGWFNDVKLADIKVDEKTGYFNIPRIVLGEGQNTLTLVTESKYGKNTFKKIITYSPKGASTESQTTDDNLSIVSLLSLLIASLCFALLLGYLVYRKRKRLKQILDKITHHENPPTPRISASNQL